MPPNRYCAVRELVSVPSRLFYSSLSFSASLMSSVHLSVALLKFVSCCLLGFLSDCDGGGGGLVYSLVFNDS